MGTINSSNRMAATLYSLGTFLSQGCVEIPCIKEIVMMMMMKETESKCRLCKQLEETIDPIISGFPILAKSEYSMRRGKVCAHLHYSICKALGIEMTYKRYTPMPKPDSQASV
jgi:hypothetical protein